MENHLLLPMVFARDHFVSIGGVSVGIDLWNKCSIF
jgi:hypothetical protein